VATYVQALDLLLLMDRKLIESFDVEEHWPEMDASETVGFDNFYDTLARWAVDQTELTYEDFAQLDFDRSTKLSEFKKKADGMI